MRSPALNTPWSVQAEITAHSLWTTRYPEVHCFQVQGIYTLKRLRLYYRPLAPGNDQGLHCS